MNAEAATDAGQESLCATASELLRAVRDQACGTAELAVAELRLAAMTGVTMLALAIIAAALALIGWGLVVAAAAQIGVAMGLSGPQALLGLGAVHVVLAWLAWRSALRLSPRLTLPALRAAVLSDRTPT
ncbi:MAG: hypothetical protein QY320_06150 [Gammaproteobacteria bacterium]|nr:MAG: hypothetical protein QY320_06150 [Gammaproteobacteria bacterium]